jgi:hypothetical protein
MNWSCGNNSERSGEISMRNPRACGSLAQHSGNFVLMFLCGLMVMPPSQFQTTNVFGGSTTEAKKITVQPIPKQQASARNKARREFHCQWPMTGAGDILAKLLLVRREDADATPSARNRHIPLLRVRRRLDGRIGEEDVTLSAMARHYGREHDLIHLQISANDTDTQWTPPRVWARAETKAFSKARHRHTSPTRSKCCSS